MLRITDIQDNNVIWDNVPFTNFDTSKAGQYILQNGDILFARTGATVGKSYLVQEVPLNSIYASYLIRIRTSNEIYPKYLKLFFESGYYWQQISEGSVGIGQPNVNGTSLGQLLLPVPPKAEQIRIINRAESLTELISSIDVWTMNLSRTIEQTKNKILDLAMQGKLVPQDPADEPAADMLLRINPKARIITDNPHYKVLPKLWILCTLESVANIKSAKRVMKDDWKNDGIPFYRTREFIKLSHDGYVDNQLYISHELYDSYKNKYGVPQTGDIMLTAVGTIGETYIVKKSDLFYYKDASVLCVQPINDLLDSAYFCLFIRSNIAQKQIHNQSKGTTVDTITIEKANNYTFILPPLEEQKRLVVEVEKLYSTFDEIEASLQS